MPLTTHNAKPIVEANPSVENAPTVESNLAIESKPIVEAKSEEYQAPTLNSDNEEPAFNAFQYWNLKVSIENLTTNRSFYIKLIIINLKNVFFFQPGVLIEPVLAGLSAMVSFGGGKYDISGDFEKSEYNDFQFWNDQPGTMTDRNEMNELDAVKESDAATIQPGTYKVEVIRGTFYERMFTMRDAMTIPMKKRETALIHSDTSEE